MVDDRRDAVVPADGQELRPELLAAIDVHRDQLVGQLQLLQGDGDLLSVGRSPEVEVDHDVFDARCASFRRTRSF